MWTNLALFDPRFSYDPTATYVSLWAPGLLPHQTSSISVSSNPHNLADRSSASHFVAEETEAHSSQISSQSSRGLYTWRPNKTSLAKSSH